MHKRFDDNKYTHFLTVCGSQVGTFPHVVHLKQLLENTPDRGELVKRILFPPKYNPFPT